MKFLANHRKDIQQLIEKHHIDQLAFSYVKRKGRINIIHDSSEKHFAYLRKKETAINEASHQWEEKTYYKVQKSMDKEVDIASWDLVMVAFDKWLSGIASENTHRETESGNNSA